MRIQSHSSLYFPTRFYDDSANAACPCCFVPEKIFAFLMYYSAVFADFNSDEDLQSDTCQGEEFNSFYFCVNDGVLYLNKLIWRGALFECVMRHFIIII